MDYDIDTLSPEHFRLKSSRRRERWKRRDREKSLLRLYRELDALRTQRRELGFERLDPPVMRGYKRYFVLRAEVARSREAKFFQGILDRINTTAYSSRRDFKKKRRRIGRRIYEVRSQELEKLWTDAFKKRKFTEQEEVRNWRSADGDILPGYFLCSWKSGQYLPQDIFKGGGLSCS